MLKKVDIAILTVTLGAVLWGAGVIAWNHWRADESARLMGCRQNLVRLAEAAARLRSQQGRNPQNLQEIEPHLPGGMRPCPSSGALTYAMVTGRESSAGFTIFCSGRNHGFLDIPEGFPQYSSAGDCVFYRPNEGLRLEPPLRPSQPTRGGAPGPTARSGQRSGEKRGSARAVPGPQVRGQRAAGTP